MKFPWFCFLHDEKDKSKETYFLPENFDWTNIIEDNFPIIYEEISCFLEHNEQDLVPYFATNMMNAPEKWKAISFYFWGFPMSKKAITSCPKTFEILKKVPHILSASVSILEPNSEIKPHYGDTDAIYRCHLPFVVPSGLPECGFRVAYEDRAWEQGKLLVFNDAAYHKAWNKTNQRRVILLFDVLKPEFASKKVWICALVRGSILWQLISNPVPILGKGKTLFSKMMCLFFAFFTYFVLVFLKRKSSWL